MNQKWNSSLYLFLEFLAGLLFPSAKIWVNTFLMKHAQEKSFLKYDRTFFRSSHYLYRILNDTKSK